MAQLRPTAPHLLALPVWARRMTASLADQLAPAQSNRSQFRGTVSSQGKMHCVLLQLSRRVFLDCTRQLALVNLAPLWLSNCQQFLLCNGVLS